MRDDERGTETVDRQIDAALRSYAEPGEIPEARVVLARVMERAWAEHRRRLGWWIGALGVPAMAVGLAAGMILWMGWGAQAPEIAWVPRAPGVAAIPVRSADGVVESHRGAREVAMDRKQATLPKLAVFPTPRPLGPQEQALVAFVQRAPASVRQAVIHDQQHWDEPIVVSEVVLPAVEIRPLGAYDKQNQESNPER